MLAKQGTQLPRSMNRTADPSYSNEGSLENATVPHNVEANGHVTEGQTSHDGTPTQKDEKMDQKKQTKQNEGKTNPHDGEEKNNQITNELLLKHHEMVSSDIQHRSITHRGKKDLVEKRRKTFSVSSSKAVFLKGKKNIFDTHLTKEKCQENIEKINEKINNTMKRILKLYNESNKKQYLSRLFQMKDINCLFSCMFFCLLIIFSIMNEYVGVLLSILLLIISIQLKFSRSNMALLNSIVAIVFISIATAYSFSNIKVEDIPDDSITRTDLSNAKTNRRLLILETVICLAYASILFIYMISLRSVKRCKEKHVWIYHHIVTFFNFLDVCILFTFGALAFFFIFICLGETLFIITSFTLFSTSVLTYSLRKNSSVGTLIVQTIAIITNAITASTSLSKNTATQRLADLPPDELGQLSNRIFLFYMIFLILFLVLHLLYIFYIFFSHKNVLAKCFSQRSAYYSSVFPHPARAVDDHPGEVTHSSANDQSDQNSMCNKKYDRHSRGNLPNRGEIHFVREKYLLSLDDENKILNVQRKSCKQVQLDMGKYTYNELHLYKHLLLNTAVELKRSLWRRRGGGATSRGAKKRGKRGKSTHNRNTHKKATYEKTTHEKLSIGEKKRPKRMHRLRSPPSQGNSQTEDFVLSINEESSECQTNHCNTDEGAITRANKGRCRRNNKKGAPKSAHFLLKKISLVQQERRRNKVPPKRPLQNYDLYLTHCENDIYCPSSLFYTKYTHIIDVLLENYDELIFYLDRKKFFLGLSRLAERADPPAKGQIVSCQNGATEGDISKCGSAVNSSVISPKSSMNDSSPPLSHPTLEKIAESPSLQNESSESSSLKDASTPPSEERSPNYMHTNWTSQLSSSVHLTTEYGAATEGDFLKAQSCRADLITSASKWAEALNGTEDELNECYSLFMLNAEGNAARERANSLFSNLNSDYMNIPVFSSASNSHTDDEDGKAAEGKAAESKTADNKTAENYFWYYSPGIIGRVYKEWLKCKNLDYKKMNNDFYYLFANSNKLHEFIKSNHTTLEKQEEIKLFNISQVLSSNNSIINSIKKSFSSFKASHVFAEEAPSSSSLNRIIHTFLMDTNSNIERLCLVDSKKLYPFLEDTNINKFLSSLYEQEGNEFLQGEMTLSPSGLTPDLIEQLNQIVAEKQSEEGTPMKGHSTHLVGKASPLGGGREDDLLADQHNAILRNYQNGSPPRGEAHEMDPPLWNALSGAPRKESRQPSPQANREDVINLRTSNLQGDHGENFDLNDLLNYAESLILQNRQNGAAQGSGQPGRGGTGGTCGIDGTGNTPGQMQTYLDANSDANSDADSTDIKHFDEILSNFIKNFVSTRDSGVPPSSSRQSEQKHDDQMNSLKNIEEIYSNIKKTICDEEASGAAPAEGSVKRNGESLAKQIIHTKKKEMHLKKRSVQNEQHLSNALKRSEDPNGSNELNQSLATGGKGHQLGNLITVKNKSKGSIECLRKKGKKGTNDWTYSAFNEYINNDLKLEKKKKKIGSKTVPSRTDSVPSDDVGANMMFTLICNSSEENVKSQKRRQNKILEEAKLHVEDTQKDGHLSETQNWGNISEGSLPAYATDGGHAHPRGKKFESAQKGSSSKLNSAKLKRERNNNPKQLNDAKINHSRGSSGSSGSSVSSTHEGGTSNAERANEPYHRIPQGETKDVPTQSKMYISNSHIVDGRENSNLEDGPRRSLLQDSQKWKGKNEKCHQTGELTLGVAHITQKGLLLHGSKSNSSVSAPALRCPLGHAKRNSEYAHEGTQKSLNMESPHIAEHQEIPSNQLKEKENAKWNHQLVSVKMSGASNPTHIPSPVKEYFMHSNQESYNHSSNFYSAQGCERSGEGNPYGGELSNRSNSPKCGEKKNDDSYKSSNAHQTSSNFNLDTHDLIKDLKKYLCSSPNSVDLEDSKLNDTFLLEFINKYLENSNPCEVSVYNEVVFEEASAKRDSHQVATEQKNQQSERTNVRGTQEKKTEYYHLCDDKKWKGEEDKNVGGTLSSNFYDEYIVNFLNTYMFENSDRLMKNAVLKDKQEGSAKVEKDVGKDGLPLDVKSAMVFKKGEKEGFLHLDCGSFYGNANHDDGQGKLHSDYYNKEEGITLKGAQLKKKQNDTHLGGSNLHRKEPNRYLFNANEVRITGEHVPWDHAGETVHPYKDRNKKGTLFSRQSMLEELVISKGKEDEVAEQRQQNGGKNEKKKTTSDIFYSISNLESVNEDEPLIRLRGKTNSSNNHSGEEKEKGMIIKKADLNLVLQSSGSEKQSHEDAPSSDEANSANGVETAQKEHPLHIYKPDVNIFGQAYGFESKLSDVSSSAGIEPSGLLVGSDALYESFAYKSFENVDNMKRGVHQMSSKEATDDAGGDLGEQKSAGTVSGEIDGSNEKDKMETLPYRGVVTEEGANRSSCAGEMKGEQGQPRCVSPPTWNHSTVHTAGIDAIGSGRQAELNRGEPNPSREDHLGSTHAEHQIGKEKNYLKGNFTNYEIYDGSKISGGIGDRTGANATDQSKNEANTQVEMNLCGKTPPFEEEKITQSKCSTNFGAAPLGDSYKNVNHVDVLQVDHNMVTKMMTYDEPEAGKIPLLCTYGGKVPKNVGGSPNNSFLPGERSSSLGGKSPIDSQNGSPSNHIKGRNKSGCSSSVEGAQQNIPQTDERKKTRGNSYQQHFLRRETRVGAGPRGGKDASHGGGKKKDDAEEVHVDEAINSIDEVEADIDDSSGESSSKGNARTSWRPPRSHTKLTLTERTPISLGNSQSTESDVEEKRSATKKWDLVGAHRHKQENELSPRRRKKKNCTTVRGRIMKNSDHIFYNSDYIKHFNSIIKTYSWSPENLHIGESNYSLKKYNTCIDTASTEDSDDASKVKYFVKDVLGENSNSIASSSGYEKGEKSKRNRELSREAKLHHLLKSRKEKRKEYKHKALHGDVMKSIKTDTQESFIELIEQGNIFPTIRRSRERSGALHRSLPSNSDNGMMQKGGKLSKRGTSNYFPSSHHSSFSHSSEQSDLPRESNTQLCARKDLKEPPKLSSLSQSGLNMEDIKVFTDDGFNDEYNLFYNWNELNKEVNHEMERKENYKKKYFSKKKMNSLRLFRGNLNKSRGRLHLSEDIYVDGGTSRGRQNGSSSPFYNGTKGMRRAVTIGDADSSNFYSLEKRGNKNAVSVNTLGEETTRRGPTVRGLHSAHDSNYELKNGLAKRGHTQNNSSSIISLDEEKLVRNDLTIAKNLQHDESVHINSNFSFESKYAGSLWQKVKGGAVGERTNLEDSTVMDSPTGKYHPKHDGYSNGGVNTGRKNIKTNSKGEVMKRTLSKREKSLTGGQTNTNHLASSHLPPDSPDNFVHELKRKLAAKNAQEKKNQMGSDPNHDGDNQASKKKTQIDAKKQTQIDAKKQTQIDAKKQTHIDPKKKTHIDPKKLTSAIRNFKNYKKMSRDNMKAAQVRLPPKNADAKKHKPLKLRYSVDSFYNVINSEDDANEDMFVRRPQQ
ncbi:conserved Plasmodium protein, unknown function [Plasmodium vivax]|uniref:Basal complex transmembrane protein 2 n=1 Tax=Plasmodium vivax TaxID=5855 RepID=A0A1G4H627_PLAVI|nr:conserved Plasmodium protein, unknown function [Plasmodium vivax]